MLWERSMQLLLLWGLLRPQRASCAALPWLFGVLGLFGNMHVKEWSLVVFLQSRTWVPMGYHTWDAFNHKPWQNASKIRVCYCRVVSQLSFLLELVRIIQKIPLWVWLWLQSMVASKRSISQHRLQGSRWDVAASSCIYLSKWLC